MRNLGRVCLGVKGRGSPWVNPGTPRIVQGVAIENDMQIASQEKGSIWGPGRRGTG